MNRSKFSHGISVSSSRTFRSYSDAVVGKLDKHILNPISLLLSYCGSRDNIIEYIVACTAVAMQ
jgi:hypothetical protein